LKEEEVIKLSNLCNFKADYAAPLKNEASGREYWRVSNIKESFVLCYLDPDIGNHTEFINISENLKNNHINAVDILHHNYELGITLQEDLGDNDLLLILNDKNKEELLKKSIDLLIQIQGADVKELRKFSENDLINQMLLYKDVFLKDFLNVDVNSSIDDLISSTIESLKNHPWTNCHFDYERRNLILSKTQEVSVIDFQDMRIGPMGIDMAGILVDHYYPLDKELIKNLLTYYSNKINSKHSVNALFEFLRYGCIQRNMRILGTLSNLYLTQNRSFRIKDLPMILSNLANMIPDNHDSKDHIHNIVQPELQKKISQI
tara:strand:+ start:5913 stop:6866 length:954 start_codon:yes stop_codon:yes gene_type:complete